MLLPLDTHVLAGVNLGIDLLRRRVGLHRPCLHRSSPESSWNCRGDCQGPSNLAENWLQLDWLTLCNVKLSAGIKPMLVTIGLSATVVVIPASRHRARYSLFAFCMIVFSNMVLMVFIDRFHTKTKIDIYFGASPFSARLKKVGAGSSWYTIGRVQKSNQRCEGCGNRGPKIKIWCAK